MRKSAIVLGLGAFFLTLGLLFKFYAYPRLAVVPLDQNTQQIVEGPDSTFLDVENLKIAKGTLTTIATVIGDPAASKAASKETGKNLAVWDKGQYSDNNGKPPPITGSTDRVVFDRNTGEAVNCCGEMIDGVAAEHHGLVVKFPFQTEKKTYQYWDGTLAKVFPIDFKAVEKIDGLTVYRFEQTVPQATYTSLEVPGFLFGKDPSSPAIKADRSYANQRVIWVEPETGVMIKVQEHQQQWLSAPGVDPIVALDTTSTFTPETVTKNVDEYGTKAGLLKMVRSTFPLVFSILGALLLLGGILMSLMGGRRPVAAATAAPAPVPGPARATAPPAAPTAPIRATTPPPAAPIVAARAPVAAAPDVTVRRPDVAAPVVPDPDVTARRPDLPSAAAADTQALRADLTGADLPDATVSRAGLGATGAEAGGGEAWNKVEGHGSDLGKDAVTERIDLGEEGLGEHLGNAESGDSTTADKAAVKLDEFGRVIDEKTNGA